MERDLKVSAWWAHKQGLDGSLEGARPVDILNRTGWVRSLGGSAPYLTFFSRGGIRREVVDAALANLEIHELPAARGCTYVVGAPDYALALAAGQPFSGDEMKVARKLGVTDAEMTVLRTAVAAALKAGTLGTDELKAKLGDTVRNLGPDGAKKGITTTLPVALGLMQSAGEIRRVPVNGRLDQQRYKYALWTPNPLDTWKQPPEQALAELARKFFDWFGPATLKSFQDFAGTGVTAAKKALQSIDLVEISRETGFIAQHEAEAFRKFRAPAKPVYALVSNIDNVKLHRGETPVMDLPRESNPIYDRGVLVGRWDFDTVTMSVVWASSVNDKALEASIHKTEAFIREDLGDVRGFSLDSPKSRVPRIEALRKAAGG